jgi:hypothetical protein
MVGAYHSWDGMMLSCVQLERQGFQVVVTKSDTDGEVMFTMTSTLTYQVFIGLPNMNRAYFRLRQQSS